MDIKVLILVIVVFLYYQLIGRVLLRALLSGVRVSHKDLIFMYMRTYKMPLIINQLIYAHKSGVLIDKDELEAHCLAGGSVENVVNGLVFAKKKGVEMSFKEASALDFDRKDVVKYIRDHHITL